MKNGKFDVYIKDSAVGTAEVIKDGLLTRIRCRAKYELSEILRLACDVGDRYEIIGVMMPKDDMFCLEKSFTKNDLCRKDLDKTQKFLLIADGEPYEKPQETHTDARVWVRCANPASLFEDAECGASLSRCDGVLKAESGEFTYIAVSADKPFPALPIFYFGQREKIADREYLVFTLKDGQLVI